MEQSTRSGYPPFSLSGTVMEGYAKWLSGVMVVEQELQRLKQVALRSHDLDSDLRYAKKIESLNTLRADAAQVIESLYLAD